MNSLFWVTMFLRAVYHIIAEGRLPEYLPEHGFTIITETPISPSHQRRLGLIPIEDL
jgi:hypothetical protein